VANNQVIVPRGADAYLRLAESKSAGRFLGKSELKLQLIRLDFQGTSYNLASDIHEVVGSSSGKQTGEKVGIGAVLGAVIGGIAGGGKGAAIGAAGGAGTGAVIQGVTKGKQIRVPSETKIDFRLEQPIVVKYLAAVSQSTPVATPPATRTPVTEAAAARGTNPSQAGTSVKADIHSVDFGNFEYRSEVLNETIRVANGEWKEATRDDNPGSSFQIVKIVYGDLKGDSQDEAVVLAAIGGGANFEIGEIFIFSMSPGGPRLFESLSLTDSGKGEEVDWSRITDVHISKLQLAISYLDGGSRACAEWAVTARLQWNGSRFLRTGRDRKPFKCQ
jgi:hypothetical protein